MLDSLKELGLDPELCSIQTEMLTGFAKAYLGEAETTEDMDSAELLSLAAATNFRRAGSNSLLLDRTQDAKSFFYQSAQAYGQARLPYAAFISNLASEPYWFKLPERGITESADPTEVFLLWGDQSLENRNEAGRIRHIAESLRTRRIGLLGLEVGIYLDLFDAAVGDTSYTQLAESLLPVMSAYSLGVRQAHQDQYHWRKLAIPFHPAEPDILALLVALDRRLVIRKRSIASFLKTIPLAWESLSLIRGALEQLGAWRDEKTELA
ncbi:MAG TPA: hypothetical protein VE863_16005 [Pyrinomonadaceae bacterium]|jgi:hypothetical protein|nr:hypothetical protein [Pyrinomonadaceae bacterium]